MQADEAVPHIVPPMFELRAQLAADWLDAQDRPNTKAAYGRDVALYFDWCDSTGLDAFQAKARDLRRYRRHIEEFRKPKAYANSTVHRRLTAVSSWYRFATQDDRELIEVNPLANVRRPRLPKASRTNSLDAGELRRVFAAADEAGLRESALLRVLFYSGARISEICNADTAELGVERSHRILWVERKGGELLRLTIAKPAADALDAYLGDRTGPIFLARRGGRLRRGEATHLVYALCRAAGITDRRISPHSFRHTAGTLARDAGADIREVRDMMGHQKVETTMRYDHSRTSVDNSPTHALARLVEGVS